MGAPLVLSVKTQLHLILSLHLKQSFHTLISQNVDFYILVPVWETQESVKIYLARKWNKGNVAAEIKCREMSSETTVAASKQERFIETVWHFLSWKHGSLNSAQPVVLTLKPNMKLSPSHSCSISLVSCSMQHTHTHAYTHSPLPNHDTNMKKLNPPHAPSSKREAGCRYSDERGKYVRSVFPPTSGVDGF